MPGIGDAEEHPTNRPRCGHYTIYFTTKTYETIPTRPSLVVLGLFRSVTELKSVEVRVLHGDAKAHWSSGEGSHVR